MTTLTLYLSSKATVKLARHTYMTVIIKADQARCLNQLISDGLDEGSNLLTSFFILIYHSLCCFLMSDKEKQRFFLCARNFFFS